MNLVLRNMSPGTLGARMDNDADLQDLHPGTRSVPRLVRKIYLKVLIADDRDSRCQG